MEEDAPNVCDGCLRENKMNIAACWCKDCSEMLCKACAKVHKRHSSLHIVIPLSTKRKSAIKELSQFCTMHENNEISFFCQKHDTPICSECVEELHKLCDNCVVSIEKAADEETSDGIMLELRKRIYNLNYEMEKIMATLQNESLDEQRRKIKDMIIDVRHQINLHLNKIEDEALNELSEIYSDSEEQRNVLIDDIRKRYEILTTWKSDDLTSRRSYESNICMFKAFKYLDKEVKNQERYVENLKSTPITRTIDFQPIDVAHLTNTMSSFGKMFVIYSPISLSTKTAKNKEKKLSLVNTFSTSEICGSLKVFRGCFIPRKRLLLCAFQNPCLYACKYDGSDAKAIEFKYQPLGVALYNSHQAVVTLGAGGIQTIDLDTLALGRRIEINGNCLSICIFNRKIWLRTDAWTLTNIDINGTILQQIATSFDPRDMFMSTNGNIYSSSNYGDALYVVTPDGEQKQFYSSPALKLPKGVAVDREGFVYVDGYLSYNIHKISPEGEGEIVLTNENEINQPRGMTFGYQTNELMIIMNDGETVHIYKLD